MTTLAHLLHLHAPHGPADVDDKHNVFGKRREARRSKELHKMAVGDLEETKTVRQFKKKLSLLIYYIHTNRTVLWFGGSVQCTPPPP